MEYRVEANEAFKMFGVTVDINTADHDAHVEIPRFWDRCIEDGTLDRIREAAGISDDVWCHGASHSAREDGFSYTICCHVPENGVVPSDFHRLAVPALTWAIFPTSPADIIETISQLQKLWTRIYTEWFPTSGYERADGPGFEMYYGIGGDENHLFCELWVPVVK